MHWQGPALGFRSGRVLALKPAMIIENSAPPTSLAVCPLLHRWAFMLSLLVLGLGGHHSHAATLLWVGDVDATWNTNSAGNTNWTTDVLPAASGDILTFGLAGGSGTLLNNDIVGLSIAGLTFNSGASAFTLSGQALTLSGALTNSSASLQTVDFAIALGGTSSLNATTGPLAFGATVSSAASDLTLSGVNTLTLGGGLSFAATTSKITTTAGDLRITGGSTIAADFFVNGGTTKFQSGAQVFNNGVRIDGASSVLNFEGASATVNGMGGGGSLDGDSLSVLNGGTINVSAGTVDVTPSRLWMQQGTINVTGGSMSTNNSLIAQQTSAVAAIHVSGGTFSLGGGNRFANNGTATLTVSGTGAVTWAAGSYGLSENGTGNIVMNGGTLAITSSGTNYLLLNGGNNMAFNTAVVSTISLNAGTLSTRGFAMNTGVNSTSRLAELRFNGGTLRATDNNGANNFIPSSANLTSKVQAGGAVIDTNGFNITIADVLEHDAALGVVADGGLTKNGTGTLTLSAANTYTGTTTLNAGTVAMVNNTGGTATYAGPISGAGGALTLSGANTLNFTGGLSMANVASTLTVTAADARINSNGSYDAAVTASGGGILKFQSGTQTFTKGLVASGAGSVLSFEGATATHSGTGEGNGNNGLLLDNGGSFNVSAGTVVLNNSTRAFIQTSTINVTGGALTINNALYAQGVGTASVVNVSGGTFTMGSSTRFANNGSATLTVSGTGAVTWASGTYGISENGAGSVVMNGGTLNMTSSGTSYFFLNGGNQSGANTAIVSSIAFNAGTLSTRGFAMNTGVNSTNRLAELRFNGGTLRATDNNGAGNFIPSSANLASKVQAGGAVIDTNNFNITIADVLEHDSALGATADGGLLKMNTGTLTLTAANTFTGKTTVAGGTLALSGAGSVGSSPWIQVNSGATLSVAAVTGGTYTLTNQVLSGTGNVTGTLAIGSGSILKPGGSTDPSLVAIGSAGDGIGSMTFANLTLATGASSTSPRALFTLSGTNSRATNPLNTAQVTAFAGASSGGLYDYVNVTGALGLNAGSTIKVELAPGYMPTWGDVFNLMDWVSMLPNADGTSGNFTDVDVIVPGGLANGWSFDTSQFVAHGLVFVVPEPSRALLLLAGATLIALQRRRRLIPNARA